MANIGSFHTVLLVGAGSQQIYVVSVKKVYLVFKPFV